MNPSNLFGLSYHLEALSKHGGLLEVLDDTADLGCFRGWLVECLGYGDGAMVAMPFSRWLRPHCRGRCSPGFLA